MNGKYYHVEIIYSNGDIQDEFFTTKATRNDYVRYIKSLGLEMNLYTSNSIGARNKNAIRSWDNCVVKDKSKSELETELPFK